MKEYPPCNTFSRDLTTRLRAKKRMSLKSLLKARNSFLIGAYLRLKSTDVSVLSEFSNRQLESLARGKKDQAEIGEEFGYAQSTIAGILPIYPRLEKYWWTNTFSNTQLEALARVENDKHLRTILGSPVLADHSVFPIDVSVEVQLAVFQPRIILLHFIAIEG